MQRILLISLLLLTIVAISAIAQERVPLDGVYGKKVAGSSWIFTVKDFSIGGRVFRDYGKPGNEYLLNEYVTLDVHGWDRFVSYAGILDGNSHNSSVITIEVDGQVVYKYNLLKGSKPIPIEIVLTGHEGLTIRIENNGAIFAEPRLVRGLPYWPIEDAPVTAVSYIAAPYFIEYSDILALAQVIRNSSGADTGEINNWRNGKLAIATPMRIDIPYPTVASCFAEDLTTALVKTGLQPIERGHVYQVFNQMNVSEQYYLNPSLIQQVAGSLGCDYLLMVSLTDTGQTVTANIRIIDVTTGKAVAAERSMMRKVATQR